MLSPYTLEVDSVTGVKMSLPLAGPGGRSYGFIIDWHIRFLLAAAWFIGMSFAFRALAGGGEAAAGYSAAWVWAVAVPSLVIYFLYHPVVELLMEGQTPGKRMAGVRIVMTDGSVPGPGPILIRNVFRLVDSLPAFYAVGLATTMLNHQHLRLGDLAAGTAMVYAPQASRKALARLENLSRQQRVAPQDADLVQELLERWNGLLPEVRQRMGARLLARLGAPVPETDEQALHEALTELLST